MSREQLARRAKTTLSSLCEEFTNRHVGSDGNRTATQFLSLIFSGAGWNVETPHFDCFDWHHGEVQLSASGKTFKASAGPYSPPCDLTAPLITINTPTQLETADITGKIVLLYGDIASEPLMPKRFPFFSVEAHQHIYHLLENKKPVAVITASARNPASAGAAYPFPMFEDGDFGIPSVYMTDEEGSRLLPQRGRLVTLAFDSRRTPARGYNVAACKPGRTRQRIVVSAHIDTKPGTPGAVDNASGCVVLTLLAELLKNYTGDKGIELVAFNGEDYYSAPGEVLYTNQNWDRMDDLFLNINLDGVGFAEGDTAFSMYNCPDDLGAAIKRTLAMHPGIVEGPQWFQGDHMIFVMKQRPALAFTSEQAARLMMEVVHTADDRPEMVDPYRLAALAVAIEDLITGL